MSRHTLSYLMSTFTLALALAGTAFGEARSGQATAQTGSARWGSQTTATATHTRYPYEGRPGYWRLSAVTNVYTDVNINFRRHRAVEAMAYNSNCTRSGGMARVVLLGRVVHNQQFAPRSEAANLSFSIPFVRVPAGNLNFPVLGFIPVNINIGGGVRGSATFSYKSHDTVVEHRLRLAAFADVRLRLGFGYEFNGNGLVFGVRGSARFLQLSFVVEQNTTASGLGPARGYISLAALRLLVEWGFFANISIPGLVEQGIWYGWILPGCDRSFGYVMRNLF